MIYFKIGLKAFESALNYEDNYTISCCIKSKVYGIRTR